MKANDIRKKFISFFEEKGHIEIPSASLVPENDPSVLFTTAGMHPLVPYLMGEKHPSGQRLVDYQKCVRTGDIDEVGDKTHLTFFEMLGNWSLGDYFKDESIDWSFEFLTSEKWLNIPVERLAVSVFAGDQDAEFDETSYEKWRHLGISDARIAKLGKDDNWWPAGGKHTGPQGPDTEIFYWTGEHEVPEVFDPENNLWVEIWNNVFMQFNKTDAGELELLSQTNVDTGMGLERITAVLQGKASVYETELFTGVLARIANVAGTDYDDQAESGESMRIIADHLRAGAMMILDGVLPSNKDHGYILRRLIRRAIRHAKKLSIEKVDVLIEGVIEEVTLVLGEAYPALEERKGEIISVMKEEGEKFEKTIKKGLAVLRKLWDTQGEITAKDAFDVYQTYGFPLELTQEIATEYGQVINREAFEKAFAEHQEISRKGAGQKFAGGLVDHSEETTKLHTATHLLHQALRMVLGDHVEQRGSNITHDRLRFDFSHPEKMTDEEKKEVERIVNEQIEKALPVHFESLSVEEAKERGAIGLFEDKYATVGDKVKVYFVGDDQTGVFSTEICGGPHVENTKELGSFRIKKEESSSSGIRRIKAILG